MRAIGPAWSSVRASGHTPSRLTRPNVGLSPCTWQNALGTRIEPPVSVPSASGARPAASAAPEPPLEPPATRDGSRGLRTVPSASLIELKPHANSCVAVLPSTIAPASRTRRTASASRSGTWPRNIAEP